MKKRLLSNRVRNAILMAILLQSIIFGIGLVVTGTFSGTVNRTYKIMKSQADEKNSLLSSHMNNLLILGNSMEEELGKIKEPEEIQDRLIDNLNHSSSADGVFYMNLVNREALVLHDYNPDIYSSNYGDIMCVTGGLESSYPIGRSPDWRPGLTGAQWDTVDQYWEKRGSRGTWFVLDHSLYYVVGHETDGSKKLIGLEVSSHILDSCLKLDHPPVKGMTMMLLSGQSVLYGGDKGEDGSEYKYDQRTGRISIRDDGISYDGVRSVLKAYGYVYGGPVYMAAVTRHSYLSGLSWDTIFMVSGVYLISIMIAVVFSYIAILVVLRPIRRLQEEIICQRPEGIHFRESGIVEIDRIHQALNCMADKLEQSYSRYSFTMESAGNNVGCFEYQEKGGKVKISPSVRLLLDIPQAEGEAVNEIAYDQWEQILSGLVKAGELKHGYSFTDSRGNRRAVSIRRCREEQGVFGTVIDKTDAYNEIERLRDISHHDQLTGLYNSTYLKNEGQKLLDRNRDRENAMVFCDLDNLKHINDNFGHETGNRYLKAMAELLASITEEEQCIAVRLSGDEFALFFYGYVNRSMIEQIVQEGYGRRPFLRLPDGTDFRVNASMGLAYARKGTEGMDSLLRRADRAMYQVKHGNKNGIAIYGKPEKAGPV